MDLLIAKKLPVMLVGPAGAGKSVVVAEKLLSLPDSYAVTNVPFNFYTTSEMLQKVLEKPLEKKAGRNYGPPGNKTMVYFIDDMNMPEVDAYGTVQPHTLIRQFMDYGHWYVFFFLIVAPCILIHVVFIHQQMHIKIYIKMHINIAPTCFSLRPSSGSLH